MLPIRNILTLADLRARTGRNNAIVRLDSNGGFYKYDPNSTATDDGVNVVKPTSVGSGSGAWINVTRRTRYFNKAGEITSPTRVFMDTFIPTSNPFTIDISSAGFTQTPIFPQIEVRETTRTNADYGSAKITALSTTSITVEITRPTVGISLGGLAQVRVGNNSTNLSMITLHVRVEGI